MLNNLFRCNFVQLLFFLILGGIVSLLTRYDVLWDLANYHYYNSWALFNDRWMYDIVPGGINTFFNPLPDVPLYLLITFFNDYPNLVIFIQGLWAGAASFVFFKLITLFFNINNWCGRLQIVLAWLTGVTSWAFFMQIGTTTNEMMMTLMVISGYYLIVKALKNNVEFNLKYFLWAGILLGAAAGLKLTAATYCVSAGVAIILCYRYFKPLNKVLMFLIIGGVIGFLFTFGFWMWRLWTTFDNPVFPLLNNIFGSEWFEPESYRDKSFLPKDIWGYVFYPFYILLEKLPVEGRAIIMDFRNIIMFFVCVGFVLFCGYWRIRDKKHLDFDKKMVFLWVLWFVSYLVWLLAFSIQRYSIQFLMLSAIIIVQVVSFFYPKEGYVKLIFYGVISILLFYSLISTPYYSDFWDKKIEAEGHLIPAIVKIWPEFEEDRKFFDQFDGRARYVQVEDIRLPENTLLKMYDQPSAAILPLLNKYSQVRGVNMFISSGQWGNVFENNKYLDLKTKIIKDHDGPVAIMISVCDNFSLTNIFYKYAKNEGMKCHLIDNNMFFWILCVPENLEKSVFFGRNYK